jgi:alkyl hydroperoxide reductase subunit AhpF
MLDLIIIGGSAAGCSAAVYAARRNLNFKMITDNLGGEVALSGIVGNWPGNIRIHGFELAQQFVAHVKHYKVDIEEGRKVEKIEPIKNHFLITAKNAVDETKQYETKTLIVATGIHPRKLNIPGENELRNKGVTYCTVCDGPLFKGKTTTTIGSGNAALESAYTMSKIANKVYILSKYPNAKKNNYGFPPAENILIERVSQLPNVEIIYNASAIEIIGQNKVTGLKYKEGDGTEKTIVTDATMIHVGQLPNSQLIDFVDKNKMGEIIVDKKCQSSFKGIFAAGDVTDTPYKQIGVATGQGITSALAAIEYINRWHE